MIDPLFEALGWDFRDAAGLGKHGREVDVERHENAGRRPLADAGQRYYLRYLNSSESSRLSYWGTRSQTNYTAGSAVAIGDFDVANIALVSPASGAKVGLPTTFRWARRTATSYDSYELDLYDPGDHNPWWWTNGIGYVDNYVLNGLPGGFGANTQYGWFAAVYSPDGGYGEPYYYRTITFTDVGVATATGAPLRPKPLRDDRRPRQQAAP